MRYRITSKNGEDWDVVNSDSLYTIREISFGDAHFIAVGLSWL